MFLVIMVVCSNYLLINICMQHLFATSEKSLPNLGKLFSEIGKLFIMVIRINCLFLLLLISFAKT